MVSEVDLTNVAVGYNHNNHCTSTSFPPERRRVSVSCSCCTSVFSFARVCEHLRSPKTVGLCIASPFLCCFVLFGVVNITAGVLIMSVVAVGSAPSRFDARHIIGLLLLASGGALVTGGLTFGVIACRSVLPSTAVIPSRSAPPPVLDLESAAATGVGLQSVL